MALKDNGCAALPVGARVLPDDQVIELVLTVLQTEIAREACEQVAYQLCIARAVRHRAHLFKIFKYLLGFKIRSDHINTST